MLYVEKACDVISPGHTVPEQDRLRIPRTHFRTHETLSFGVAHNPHVSKLAPVSIWSRKKWGFNVTPDVGSTFFEQASSCTTSAKLPAATPFQGQRTGDRTQKRTSMVLPLCQTPNLSQRDHIHHSTPSFSAMQMTPMPSQPPLRSGQPSTCPNPSTQPTTPHSSRHPHSDTATPSHSPS